MRHHRILRVVSKLLIPSILLFGLYVQFHGEYGPGGGFQAGVIFASAFILYGLVYGLHPVQKVLPQRVVTFFVAFGLLLYAGVGVAAMLLGGQFLNYSVLADSQQHGQHYGIIVIELGVGITVAAVMVSIFYAFAGRSPDPEEQMPERLTPPDITGEPMPDDLRAAKVAREREEAAR